MSKRDIEGTGKRGPHRSERGFSLLELAVVGLILITLSAIALPQLLASRRLYHFNGVTREVVGQLRYARQQAMSLRRVVRFRYDNATKRITITNLNERNVPVVGVTFNPNANANTTNDAVLRTMELTAAGVPANNITYGRPTGVTTAALADTTNLTSLTSNRIDIFFQPDGSVLDNSGNPQNPALFLYNNQAPRPTLRAISILGAGGRVRLWRYNENGNSFVEQ